MKRQKPLEHAAPDSRETHATPNQFRHLAAVLGAASALALAGCGGSGSSSSETDSEAPGGNGGDSLFVTLERLSGLDVEATRDELLFYKSDEPGDPGLRAIHPDQPHDPVSFDVQISTAQRDITVPVIEGDWDSDAFELTNIERPLVVTKIGDIGTIEDMHEQAVARIETDAATADDPEATIVGEQRFLNPMVGLTGVAQSPTDPDAADIWTRPDEDDNFFYTPGTDEGAEVPYISSENANGLGIVSVRDIETMSPAGWLSVEEDAAEDNELVLLDTDGERVGAVTSQSSAGISVDGVNKIGEIMPDGSYYLELYDEGNQVAERQIWHYVPDAQGGTMAAVTDQTGNVVDVDDIASGFLGLGIRPHLTVYGDGGALFFAAQQDEHALYRLEGTELAQVDTADAGLLSVDSDILFRGPDSIIWMTDEGETIRQVSLDGSESEIIADAQSYRADFHSGLGGLREYRTPVHAVHEDGWMFYTAEDSFDEVVAIAHNLDTGKYRAIEDAEWVGASSDGSLGEGGFLGMGRPAEVFLIKTGESGDPILGVVDAAAPLDGMVELGTLPAGTETVTQGHVGRFNDRIFAQNAFAAGPHRLFRANLDSNDSRVIYVDVREEGSMVPLGNAAAPNSLPVGGY